MKYYKRYSGDFLRDTMHLSLAEVGVYDRLLDHYYSHEKPLPDDPPRLYRICHASTRSERKGVVNVLQEFFYLDADDGCWHNRRADAEIADASRLGDVSRQNGRLGGRPRTKTPSQGQGQLLKEGNGAAPDEQPRAHPVDNRSKAPRRSSDSGVKHITVPFVLSDALIRWTREERPVWTDDDIEVVRCKFEDHWKAKTGKDSRKSDWESTWRNWVRDERVDANGRPLASRGRRTPPRPPSRGVEGTGASAPRRPPISQL